MRASGWVLGWVLLSAVVNAEPDLKAEAREKLQRIEEDIDAWNVFAAEQQVAELEKIVPPDIEPVHYFKGRIAFEKGQYKDAIDELTAAGIQDKDGSYLRLAKETLKVTQNDKKIESEHFIFYYPPGKDEILAPYALETLEAQRAALAKDLGYSPPEKIRVEIVNDAHELAKVSTLTFDQIRTTGTIAICKFSKLMVTSPKAVVRGYDWQDTLAHEFTHLVVTRTSSNTVPIWLHEGMAKYLESRWRGSAGLAISPSSLALLGARVKQNKLVTFEQMHPSIALLKSSADAATAFAEVFYAVDLLFREHGATGLRQIIAALSEGKTDREAVEVATGKSFAAFEKAWLAHMKQLPFPKELKDTIPDEKVSLAEVSAATAKKKEGKKGHEISYGELGDVTEDEPRKFAHLGEVLREHRHFGAAAEEFGKAHALVGDKYEAVSNKYALALLAVHQTAEAEKVLLGTRILHPGSAATEVHLGRIYLARREFAKAKDAYIGALAADPFDVEIHFGLLRAHLELGETTLAQRERKASATLTGLKEADTDQVAKSLAAHAEDLSQVDVPPPQATTTAPRLAPADATKALARDAGTPPSVR